ncbi:uncharacterized protein LOC125036229 [Penaeus chinensis]|uniref:uncharacterized protein LOC125036229 n=1 Tax=Penaeus chinensis TaxID=139456 RepID=UPI001FB7F327|nr:uncharacterized protein LOC125036229 [Penaeus chinensis]
MYPLILSELFFARSKNRCEQGRAYISSNLSQVGSYLDRILVKETSHAFRPLLSDLTVNIFTKMHRVTIFVVCFLVAASVLLPAAEARPQIHSYDVAKVNAEVFEEQDEVEESERGGNYVEIQESVDEDGASPTGAAGSIALEVLDEVGDALGSRGAALRRMEALLEASRGAYGR